MPAHIISHRLWKNNKHETTKRTRNRPSASSIESFVPPTGLTNVKYPMRTRLVQRLFVNRKTVETLKNYDSAKIWGFCDRIGFRVSVHIIRPKYDLWRLNTTKFRISYRIISNCTFLTNFWQKKKKKKHVWNKNRLYFYTRVYMSSIGILSDKKFKYDLRKVSTITRQWF